MASPADATTFVYVTYIRATPEAVWNALTSTEAKMAYWFDMRQESDWTVGASWRLLFEDGRVADTGEILEADRPRRLVISWRNEFRPDMKAEGYSRFVCDIETVGQAPATAVKLTITHTMDRPDSRFIGAVTDGWSQILSNLKSLLETGQVVITR